jgi:purine-nucleoside phosphorylase
MSTALIDTAAAEMTVLDKTQQAAEAIRRVWPTRPRVGIVLGTGLGSFCKQITSAVTVPYAAIPYFPQTTALGHKGQFVAGRVGQVPVLVMDGRFHCYEGYSVQQTAWPIRVMRALGIEFLVLSNASGGVHPRLNCGDIVVVDDHINLMWGSPLAGIAAGLNTAFLNADVLQNLPAPYDAELNAAALAAGIRQGYPVHRGVYAAMIGPNYETRAEYRMLRRIGADVVGMSTVPEVVVAAQARLRVLALSVVTNVCRPDQLTPTSGQAVLATAESTEPKVRDLVAGVLSELA